MVCSMALGKFLRVHMGMDFSGGSRDDPYDSVRFGTTTCRVRAGCVCLCAEPGGSGGGGGGGRGGGDLYVALGAEGAALEQRLVVVDAPLVHVQPRLPADCGRPAVGSCAESEAASGGQALGRFVGGDLTRGRGCCCC